MKALLLGACLAAVLGAPSLAQPYDQGGGYQDQRDPYYDQGQPDQGQYDQDRGYDQDDRGYQGDRRYDDDSPNYDRDNRAYDHDRSADNGYGGPGRGYGVPAGAHFTGRTGASWRNDEGQYCTWRELSWQDAEGNPAYRWVPRCRG